MTVRIPQAGDVPFRHASPHEATPGSARLHTQLIILASRRQVTRFVSQLVNWTPNGDIDHVGIVTSTNSSTVITIEGNSDERVKPTLTPALTAP